jgi:hypothetical protein
VTLGKMPAAEFDIDERLVRALLEGQHADLATLEFMESSADNPTMGRVGRATLEAVLRDRSS